MTVPYNPTYVVLGGLLSRTKAVDCWKWTGLLAYPRKRGGNRPRSQGHGSAVRPRWRPEGRALLEYRLDGSYVGNTPIQGSEDVKYAAVYDHLAELQAVVDVMGVQELEFNWPGGQVTVDAVVEEMTEPDHVSPWLVKVVVDVTLPDGPIVLPAGS